MYTTKPFFVLITTLLLGVSSASAECGAYVEIGPGSSLTISEPLRFETTIHENKLVVTFTNTSQRPILIQSHIDAQERHYDNLSLLVIDPELRTHRFGFVKGRDKSVPILKTIEAGQSYELDIDLQAWNENGANEFKFEDDTEYVVVCSYKWSRVQGLPIHGIKYDVSYTADAMRIIFKDGQVSQI